MKRIAAMMAVALALTIAWASPSAATGPERSTIKSLSPVVIGLGNACGPFRAYDFVIQPYTTVTRPAAYLNTNCNPLPTFGLLMPVNHFFVGPHYAVNVNDREYGYVNGVKTLLYVDDYWISGNCFGDRGSWASFDGPWFDVKLGILTTDSTVGC